MKPFHVITLSFALFFFVEAAAGQLEENQCADYRGTFSGSDFGDHSKIGMTLFVAGRSITGTYFNKGDLGDFPLEGSYQSDREITLTNLDSAGKPNGRFKLRFVESDPSRQSDRPLTSDRLIGTWVPGSGQRSLQVFLSLTGIRPGKCAPRYAVAGASDDRVVEHNIQAFYFAVLKRQKSLAAEYVSYPATFELAGKRRKIANSAQFLRYYDRLFTKQFVAKIADDIPHNMFANSQGIMIADGAVWFNEHGKAMAFNNAQ